MALSALTTREALLQCRKRRNQIDKGSGDYSGGWRVWGSSPSLALPKEPDPRSSGLPEEAPPQGLPSGLDRAAWLLLSSEESEAMGLSLLPLPLLLLLASLRAGSSEECNPESYYGVNQPESLSAPEGGSICISFTYFHCWELARDPSLSVALRRTHFHGEMIYNSTRPFIHKDYKNRISLDLKEGQNSGTVCISNLRKEDENMYFCRVQVKTRRDGWQVWQSVPGTKLSITDAVQVTTKGPTTAVTTTADFKDNGSSVSSPLSVGAAVGVALAGVVLITAILGLVIFLRCKRSKGLQTKARTVAGESVQNTEEKYENIGITRRQTESKLDPKGEARDEGGILYASLTLSSSSSPAAPPCTPPTESPQETLYSIIKAQ